MYVKPTPACPTCFGDQKRHGLHKKWQDCQAELAREDLRCRARYVRPKSGTIARAWNGHERTYA